MIIALEQTILKTKDGRDDSNNVLYIADSLYYMNKFTDATWLTSNHAYFMRYFLLNVLNIPNIPKYAATIHVCTGRKIN